MNTKALGISSGTLVALLYGFAMVPLPSFQGSPTGLKLAADAFVAPYIVRLEERDRYVMEGHKIDHQTMSAEYIRDQHLRQKELLEQLPDGETKKRLLEQWKRDLEKKNRHVDDWRELQDEHSARALVKFAQNH